MEFDEEKDSEQQLNELRERTIAAEKYERSEKYREKRRERALEKARAVLMGIVLFLCVLALGMLVVHNYTYTTYSLDQETHLSQGKTAKMFPFRNGSIIVSGDSVTYFVGEKQEFTVSLSVKNPGFSTAGSYFTLYSEGAYEGYLFSESGLQCRIKTDAPVHGMACATTGVSVALTSQGEAAQLSYYNRHGASLSVAVQSTMGKTGYPVAFSLSPDGQKLAVVYYSVRQGLGESDLLVYDFENGRADQDYIRVSYDNYYETDTFLADVYFTDNSHFTAVGDNYLYFYDLSGKKKPTEIPLTGTVSSAKQIGSDTLLVYQEDGETICSRYDRSGKMKHTFRCVAEYEHITANEHYVLFWGGENITFYNASGVLRYTGTLVAPPISISFSGSRSLLLNNGETL